MKLEAGMYVRTNLGIAKYLGKAVSENYITREIEQTEIDEFDQLNEELWSGDVPNWVFECDMEDVVLKTSHNIIDLIELGDYVNGYMVRGISVSTLLLDNFNMIQIDEKDIKTIVTKEQFESMSYKIGD